MFINPIYLSNRIGIPRIEPSAITIGTSSVSLKVPNSRTLARKFNGLVLMKFTDSIASDTTSTLPIILTTEDGITQAITTAGGSAYTVANYSLGIHLFYYESDTNTLQFIA